MTGTYSVVIQILCSHVKRYDSGLVTLEILLWTTRRGGEIGSNSRELGMLLIPPYSRFSGFTPDLPSLLTVCVLPAGGASNTEKAPLEALLLLALSHPCQETGQASAGHGGHFRDRFPDEAAGGGVPWHGRLALANTAQYNWQSYQCPLRGPLLLGQCRKQSGGTTSSYRPGMTQTFT